MRHVEVVPAMGTKVSVDIRTQAPPERIVLAVREVTARLQAIDETFSAWRPDSWVSNLIGGLVAPGDCPDEVQHVVELASTLVETTDGYFSPYWRRLSFGDPGPDPTGLVKGWAAQQASDVLVAHGLSDHVVNAAGDVVVSGRSTPDDPASTWRVGISDPHDPQHLIGVVVLDQSASRWAVATSGTAELGAHVSDPHDGSFVDSVASATVATSLDERHEGAAVADACATALVAAGAAAATLLEAFAQDGLAAMYVDSGGHVCDPRALLSAAHDL